VPGDGLLATVIPGAWDGWMLMLRDHGRLPLRTVLEPAIHYAEAGHPCLPRVADTIAGLGDFFRDTWPSSYRTWLPDGRPPAPASVCSAIRHWQKPIAASSSRPKAAPAARRRSRRRATPSIVASWPRRSATGSPAPNCPTAKAARSARC
jgi:hypothetical protein